MVRKPAAGSKRKPAAGSKRKPAAGSKRKPAAGSKRKPAAGSKRKPAAGSKRKPAAGSKRKPAAGSKRKPAAEKEPLRMKIGLVVMEELGTRLHGTLPPVISDLVANAWDADATRVSVELPAGDIDEHSAVAVRDDGAGMSRDDVLRKYLRIDRRRRDEDGGRTPGGRDAMGRKGIGKISAFGVADRIAVTTIKDGKRNGFEMDAGGILERARDVAARKSPVAGAAYEPAVTASDEDADGPDGTTVTLSGLKRKGRVVPGEIRKSLSDGFSVLGDGFRVYVNGDEVGQPERIAELNTEGTWGVAGGSPWKVSGSITATILPLDDADRGLAIMARGRRVQAPTAMGADSGEYPYRHITGRIHAEFMDDDEDLVAADRQSVAWEHPRGEALGAWCAEKLGKVSSELAERMRAKRELAIRNDPEIGPRLEKLTEAERREADKRIRAVASIYLPGGGA